MRDDVKPSLEQLKAGRDNARNGIEHGERIAREYRADLAEYDAQIAAEEEREAKAKEWPQEGDEVWWLDSQGSVTETTSGNGWKAHILAMGLLFRTRADAELVRDFLRSRPRGWLLAMAKLGEPGRTYVHSLVGDLFMEWTLNQLTATALTEDERAALLGQG